jgi:hypothetical protein
MDGHKGNVGANAEHILRMVLAGVPVPWDGVKKYGDSHKLRGNDV